MGSGGDFAGENFLNDRESRQAIAGAKAERLSMISGIHVFRQ